MHFGMQAGLKTAHSLIPSDANWDCKQPFPVVPCLRDKIVRCHEPKFVLCKFQKEGLI